MPLPTPTAAAAATSDSLSQHAAHLSASLARRRADLALLRAEAATVALSLESAKHRLDLALRDETVIHAATAAAAAAAAAPSSPRASFIHHHAHTAAAATTPDASSTLSAPARAHASASDPAVATAAAQTPDKLDPAPTHERAALARSLTTQLDVTHTALRDAIRRRDALRHELVRLQSAAATTTAGDVAVSAAITPTSGAGGGAVFPGSTAPVNVSGTARRALDNYTASTDPPLRAPLAASPTHAEHPLSAATNPQRLRNAPATASIPPVSSPPTDPLLTTLRDAVKSDTSFRADHARIWRDATMPNLVLVSPDSNGSPPPQPQGSDTSTPPRNGEDARDASAEDPGVSLGVVTERIFEGVTCFTPTDRADTTPSSANHASDLRIVSHGPVASPDPSVMPRVARHYAVLSAPASHPGGADPKIIAPRTALSRALNLIRDPEGSAAGRRRKWRAPRLTSGKKPPSSQPATPTTDAGVGVGTEEASATTKTNGGEEVVPVDKDTCGAKPDNESKPPRATTPRLPVPKLSHKSTVLTGPQFAAIVADGVPVRFHDSALSLLYSTERDGMSLRTLYSRVHAASPTLVAIRDTRGRVFGCYGAQPWKSSATRYYGSGESFVFGTTRPWRDDDDNDDDNDDNENENGGNDDGSDDADANVKQKSDATKEQESVSVYKWSRDNSFFQFTSASFLAIGGGAGSHFALWIDEDLLMGTTSACSTFASPPLVDLGSEDEDESLEFKILVVEVWGFGVRALR